MKVLQSFPTLLQTLSLTFPTIQTRFLATSLRPLSVLGLRSTALQLKILLRFKNKSKLFKKKSISIFCSRHRAIRTTFWMLCDIHYFPLKHKYLIWIYIILGTPGGLVRDLVCLIARCLIDRGTPSIFVTFICCEAPYFFLQHCRRDLNTAATILRPLLLCLQGRCSRLDTSS